jgi:tetratricopeptide (TPR) repeat protein
MDDPNGSYKERQSSHKTPEMKLVAWLCIVLSVSRIGLAQSCPQLNKLYNEIQPRVSRDSAIRLAYRAVDTCCCSNEVGYIIALHNLAECYYGTNLRDSNLKYASKAYEVYQKSSLNNASFTIRLLVGLGDALEKNDMIDSAEITFKTAMAVSRRLVENGNPPDRTSIGSYLICVNSITQFYMNRQKFFQPEKYFEEAFQVIEKYHYPAETDYYYFLILEAYGGLQLNTGQYDTALSTFQSAMRFFSQNHMTDSLQYGALMDNIGVCYQHKGHYTLAYPFFVKSLELRKRWSNRQDIGYSKSLNNLSALEIQMDRYQEAFILLKELDSLTGIIGKNSSDHINALNSIATAYAQSGRFKEADSVARLSLAITRPQKKEKPSNFAFSLFTSGEVFRLEKKHRLSILYYDSSLSAYHAIQGKNQDELNIIRNNLATQYDDTEQYDRAVGIYKQIIAEHRQQYPENKDRLYIYLSNLATAYLKSGKLKEALSLMPECFTGIRQYMQNRLGIQSQDEKQLFIGLIDNILQIFKSMVYRGGPQTKIKYAALVYNNELMMKQFLLTSNQKVKKMIEQSADTSLINLYIHWKDDMIALNNMNILESGNHERIILNQNIRLEERELSRLSQVFSDQLAAFSAGWTPIRDSLKTDEILLDFFFFHEYSGQMTANGSIRYGAFVIRKGVKEPVWVDLCSEAALNQIMHPRVQFASERDKINAIYGLLIHPEGGRQPENASNERLFGLIWKPLLPYLSRIQKIYFSPVRTLGSIALTSLHDRQSFLIDRYELEQVQNGLEICESNKRNFDLTSLAVKGPHVVLFGGISYNYQGTVPVDSTKFYDSLPMTGQEVSTIENLLKGQKIEATVFTGQQASEEELKKFDGRAPSILHIGTHGFFRLEDTTLSIRPDPLTRSALLLARGNYALGGGSVPNVQEDGIFNASEASLLDFRKTQLVVLSACETGVGEIWASEGIFSLQRGFKIAGVGYILVSLWKISEEGTFTFMQTFYNNVCNGKSLEQAFRLTQLEMKKIYNPYYWAAFTLVK